MRTLMAAARVVVGEAKGRIYECGSPSGWLKANNAMAKNVTC